MAKKAKKAAAKDDTTYIKQRIVPRLRTYIENAEKMLKKPTKGMSVEFVLDMQAKAQNELSKALALLREWRDAARSQ